MFNAVVTPATFLWSNHKAFSNLLAKSLFRSSFATSLLPLFILFFLFSPCFVTFLLTAADHHSGTLCPILVLQFIGNTTFINLLLLTRRLFSESPTATIDCTPVLIFIIKRPKSLGFSIFKTFFFPLLSRLTRCLCLSIV